MELSSPEPGRPGSLHSRTIEVLDQRGIANRFLSQGKVMQVAGFAMILLLLDILAWLLSIARV